MNRKEKLIHLRKELLESPWSFCYGSEVHRIDECIAKIEMRAYSHWKNTYYDACAYPLSTLYRQVKANEEYYGDYVIQEALAYLYRSKVEDCDQLLEEAKRLLGEYKHG
jgi:hypothetical protein